MVLKEIAIKLKVLIEGLKNMEIVRKTINKFKKDVVKTAASLTILKESFAQMMKQFQGWLLSLLFFGMAMQRVFNGIIKSGVSTFLKITESSGMFGSAIQRLAVHWTYLKFVIGSAINRFIEPLMPIIIRVINAVSEWVQKNQGLTAGLLIAGSILGTFLVALGTFGLAILGLAQGFLVLKPILIAVFGFLSGVGLSTIFAVVAAVAALYLAWKSNFGGMRDFIKATLKNISFLFKDVFGLIFTVVVTVMKAMTAIMQGDWDSAWKHIKDGTMKSLNFILNILAVAAGSIVNVLSVLWNLIVDRFYNIVYKGILFLVNKLLGLFKKSVEDIPGAKKLLKLMDKIHSGLRVDSFFKAEDLRVPTKEFVNDKDTQTQTKDINTTFVIQNLNLQAQDKEDFLRQLQRRTPSGGA